MTITIIVLVALNVSLVCLRWYDKRRSIVEKIRLLSENRQQERDAVHLLSMIDSLREELMRSRKQVVKANAQIDKLMPVAARLGVVELLLKKAQPK